MAICSSCGTDNLEGAVFCDTCGAPFSGTLPAAAPPMSAPPAAGFSSVCPSCGGGVLAGEAFCENCGAALNLPAPSQAMPTPALGTPADTPFVQAPASAPHVAPGSPPRVRLLIQPAGVEVTFPNKPEVVVGRTDISSNFFPDVDLDPFDAASNGVSRRHARVLIQGGQVLIEDLDTTNGTAINRRRLAPGQAQPLRDGDEVRFGKLVATFRYG